MLAQGTLSQCRAPPGALGVTLGKEQGERSPRGSPAHPLEGFLPFSSLLSRHLRAPHTRPGLVHPFHPAPLRPGASPPAHALLSSSSPMAFALSTYMNHTGIRSREPRVASASEKAQALPDKDKWLPFFPKAKKVGGGAGWLAGSPRGWCCPLLRSG